MGAVASLSRGATLCALDIAQIAVFVFGFLFLVGWIAEETAKEDPWKKYRVLFVIMAISGVAGEWIADIAVFALSEHSQTISDKEVAKLKRDAQRLATEEADARRAIADAQRDVSKATALAKEAESHLAEANARAAESNRMAEQERLARVKIEERLAPRSFTLKQRTAIVEAIKGFSGQPVRVMRTTNDEEVWGFSRIVAALLASANWKTELDGMTTTPVDTGLFIEINPTDGKANVAAGNLQRAFQANGFAMPGGYDTSLTDVLIIVGTKPR